MKTPASLSPILSACVALLLVVVLSAACAERNEAEGRAPETPGPDVTLLPLPRRQGALSLEECLQRRRSVRTFAGDALTLEQIGQLLWAAQGITDPRGYRTAPSAGALYPLEVYVVTSESVFHYDPAQHALATVKVGDVREPLAEAALGQQAAAEAPTVLVITGVYERTEAKYGAERSPRYVHLEAGHAAQNVLLQAVALGLGAVPIGAFDDQEVQEVLDLPSDHLPLYLIPVGNPR